MRHPWKKLFNIKCLSPLRGVQDPGIQYEPPVFGRTTSTQEMVLPATSDLLWMEGALAGLVAYVATPLERRHGGVHPADVTCVVPLVGGEAPVQVTRLGLDTVLPSAQTTT